MSSKASLKGTRRTEILQKWIQSHLAVESLKRRRKQSIWNKILFPHICFQVRSTLCGARSGSACTLSTWSAGWRGSPGHRSTWSVVRGSSQTRLENWARSRTFWAFRGSSRISISTSTKPKASHV